MRGAFIDGVVGWLIGWSVNLHFFLEFRNEVLWLYWCGVHLHCQEGNDNQAKVNVTSSSSSNSHMEHRQPNKQHFE